MNSYYIYCILTVEDVFSSLTSLLQQLGKGDKGMNRETEVLNNILDVVIVKILDINTQHTRARVHTHTESFSLFPVKPVC